MHRLRDEVERAEHATAQCGWDVGLDEGDGGTDGPNCPYTTPETTARVDNIVDWISTVVPDLPTGASPPAPTPAPAPTDDSSNNCTSWELTHRIVDADHTHRCPKGPAP